MEFCARFSLCFSQLRACGSLSFIDGEGKGADSSAHFAIRPTTRWVAFYLRTKWIPGRQRCQISCFPRSIQLSPLLRFVRQIRLCARHRQINSRKARLSIEEPPNWNGGACRLSSVERRKWEDNFSRSTSGLPLPRGQMRIKRKSVSESSLDGLQRTNKRERQLLSLQNEVAQLRRDCTEKSVEHDPQFFSVFVV